jgi:hypothetical protein
MLRAVWTRCLGGGLVSVDCPMTLPLLPCRTVLYCAVLYCRWRPTFSATLPPLPPCWMKTAASTASLPGTTTARPDGPATPRPCTAQTVSA